MLNSFYEVWGIDRENLSGVNVYMKAGISLLA
jgi:hypothetical protein